MIALTGVSPLLSVYDMPAAIRFYRDRLGFTVVHSSPEIEAPEGRYFHWATLRRGDAELMLNTAYDAGERPAHRDEARWAGHADTWLYVACSSPGDVDALHAELGKSGLELAPPTTAPYGMRQLTVRDLDGYVLVFQAAI